jgi:hypothetical protein
MSGQHTPGPWIVRTRSIPYKDGSKSHVERSICQQRIHPQLKDHLPVVCMSMGLGMDGEKAVPFVHIEEEDAHLIAAAPALYEALAALLESHAQLVNSGDCGFWDVEEEAPVKLARAALAAARPNKEG